MDLSTVQIEIIYKSFMYVLNNEGVQLPEKYNVMFDAILNYSPYNTNVSDVADNMEVLFDYLKNNTDYLVQELD